MPFFFIVIGIGLIVIGYRGTQDQFFALLKGDFSGPNNFVLFATGIFVVGLAGYVPKLKGLSDAFMGLLIVVIILANKGFFNQLTQELQKTTQQQPQKQGAQ
jgi:hypothetical protein